MFPASDLLSITADSLDSLAACNRLLLGLYGKEWKIYSKSKRKIIRIKILMAKIIQAVFVKNNSMRNGKNGGKIKKSI
jgi:hypothetical protein